MLHVWQHDVSSKAYLQEESQLEPVTPQVKMATIGTRRWAFGVLVYEMLCGFTPFLGPNNAHVRVRIFVRL